MPNKNLSQADIDWENRTLCLDESCIGVIGPDGCCKECGKSYEGFEYRKADTVETAETGETEVPDENDIEVEDPTESEFDEDWENRTLCVDENCIGVIGPDGRCKECGKAYEENG